MTPLITRAQGAACRRAAERESRYAAMSVVDRLNNAHRPISRQALDAFAVVGLSHLHNQLYPTVLMALLWCAEIAEEA